MATGHLPLSPHRRTEAQQELYSQLESKLHDAQRNLNYHIEEARQSRERVEALQHALRALRNAP